ncbi:MAG: C2 family cysteine protease [Planctomycetota bacterium]
MFGRTARTRRSSSPKPSVTRNRLLRSEALEPRTMLSGSGLSSPTARAALVGGVKATVNATPTIAQSVIINSNAAVTGKTALLSVLGSDDGGAANLKYTWSVTSAPTGGTVNFSSNGVNASKLSTATFSKAGTYSFTVKIVDAGGLSVSSVKTVVVNPTLTSISVRTAGGQVVSPGTTSALAGTAQSFVTQVLDQFGAAFSLATTFTWSTASLPSGAAAPTLTPNSNVEGVKFSAAGNYVLTARATAGGVSISTNVGVGVSQVLTSTKYPAATMVYVTGTSLQPVVPAFLDQFGKPMTNPPALTWSTVSLPSGASAPVFTTSGGVTTVTFGQAGYYMLQTKSTTGSTVSFVTQITVNQTLTSIAVSPNVATVSAASNQQFTAQALDQFKKLMATLPALTWSSSGGSVSSGGVFTAPSSLGSCTVTAKSGSIAGTAAVTVQAATGWNTTLVGNLVQSLDADGSLSRQDMIQILTSIANNGAVTAGELADLKTILSKATTLNIAGYVQALANDIINGNPANATYQGAALGNLAVGSSSAQLTKLIGKWFLGTDHPVLCNTSLTYKTAAGSLFPHTPTHLDEYQGMLGDCYLISALGTLADSNPAAIQNMIINNGDGTYTVRFYTGPYGISGWPNGGICAGFSSGVGTADYITVDSMLVTSSSGMLAYANYGASCTNSANALWIPLIEKAYAQWNQTGKEGRDGTNAFASIQGGWMATVDAQVLGYNAIDYIMTTTSKQVAVSALTAHKAVTIGTLSWSAPTNLGLYANHAYAITAYNASTDTFTLYNPWGSNQPGQLTWAQLQATCSQLCVCDTSGTVPITGAPKVGSTGASLRAAAAGISLSARFTATASQPVVGQSPSSDSSSARRQLFWSMAYSEKNSSQPSSHSDRTLDGLDASLVDEALALGVR